MWKVSENLCEKYQPMTVNNVSLYPRAWPQDKFLPAHFTPMSIRYTGLNMLPNSFLSVKEGKFLIFLQRIAIRYEAVKKKKSFPFKKAQQTNTLQQFLEQKKFFRRK